MRARGDAPAAPAVAAHHHRLAGDEHIGGADYTVEGALACAIAIIEHVLGIGVVHSDDGIFELALLLQRPQADDARSGFFRCRVRLGSSSRRDLCNKPTTSAPSSIVMLGLLSSTAVMCL